MYEGFFFDGTVARVFGEEQGKYRTEPLRGIYRTQHIMQKYITLAEYSR